MTEFLLAAFMLLAVSDPAGYSVARGHTVTESSTPINGYHAYAQWPPFRYTVQTSWYQSAYPSPYNRMVLACTLAHEGAHLRFRTSEETIPLMQQYVCLDRIGAPKAFKDFIYGELQKSLMPPPVLANE